jgi:titin
MPFAGYFPSDFTQLPTVSIVVPNLYDDMHSGTIQQGDTWLQNNLGAYAQWAMTHNSLLIVTFDEDNDTSNNHIPTLFVGQVVQPGAYSEQINHFNVLRTIEDMYGLPYAGASATATPITDIWASPPSAAPSNLVATRVSGDQVALTWTDNAGNETGYNVERSADGVHFTQIATLAKGSSNYLDSDVAPGAYSYRIDVFNALGTASSNVASVAVPVAATDGSGPSNLSATPAGPGQVNLAWTDNSGGQDTFAVLRSPDGSNYTQIATLGAGVTGYSDTGLSPATYYYQEVATNPAGGTTEVVSAALAPAAPSGLTATPISGGEISLAWTRNSSNETGFVVSRSTDGVNFSQVATVGADITSYSDFGLAQLTTYYYEVQATNATGSSALSNTASATTPAQALPAAPSNLVATVPASGGATTINPTWTNNSSGTEQGFRIYKSTDGVTFNYSAAVGPGVTSYSANYGLSPGTTYWFEVRAYNSAGYSSYSNAASATTLALAALE